MPDGTPSLPSISTNVGTLGVITDLSEIEQATYPMLK